MQQALALARRGAGFVNPNPMVGAVLVYNNKIIAQGYHAKFGGAHAERNLLRTALKKYSKTILAQAHLYLTLEPCSRTNKKTPPCLPLILNSGIKQVIIGSVDPHPQESGNSIKLLKKHGIKVNVGIKKNECDYLIRAFRKWSTTQQPYIIGKVALSLDGKITTPNNQRYLANKLALQRVHELRQECSAIMVGVNTIIHDNPKLNTRLSKKQLQQAQPHHPIKIILDHHLRTPVTSCCLDKNTIIVCSPSITKANYKKYQCLGVKILPVSNLKKILFLLGKRGFSSILVEGGASVLTSFINQRLIDEWWYFITPQLFGAQQLPVVGNLQYSVNLKNIQTESLGDNLLIKGDAQYDPINFTGH
jgi:diaminohydroxyphosphoribosylaminopyrimidine deaminase/5-amino-6-(5-phosphoribosylamino)uracil reductase